MKYRLKKDLPFAKAGTEVGCDFSNWYAMTNRNYFIGFTDETDRLISEGWIEEVKPREWYEVETEDTFGHWHWTGIRYTDKQVAREATCYYPQNTRFIKVREVIE